MNLTNFFSKAACVLNPLYTDTADVFRNAEQGNVQGFSKALSAVSCHLSLDAKPQLVQGPQTAQAESEFTLYCLPDTDIREGDRLVIWHKGKAAEYDVGTVHRYDLNLVCRCKKRGIV